MTLADYLKTQRTLSQTQVDVRSRERSRDDVGAAERFTATQGHGNQHPASH
ncbi:hypothetical protein [Streptomyces sp. NPDC091217]|uniref:hypothetical protein n=1 Tax=Streptomyces sp. NPDC091217 TaxID=3365975 RepID=UPI00380C2E11